MSRSTIFDGFYLTVSFGGNRGKRGSRSVGEQTYRIMMNPLGRNSIGADFWPHDAKLLIKNLRKAASGIKRHAGLKGRL
jgi:hypothetical protein